jgi:hypothetical protein
VTSIHNDPMKMIEKFTDSTCIIIMTEKGVAYLSKGGTGQVIDVLAEAIRDVEFAGYLEQAMEVVEDG